jgi:hypothetical protein
MGYFACRKLFHTFVAKFIYYISFAQALRMRINACKLGRLFGRRGSPDLRDFQPPARLKQACRADNFERSQSFFSCFCPAHIAVNRRIPDFWRKRIFKFLNFYQP